MDFSLGNGRFCTATVSGSGSVAERLTSQFEGNTVQYLLKTIAKNFSSVIVNSLAD